MGLSYVFRINARIMCIVYSQLDKKLKKITTEWFTAYEIKHSLFVCMSLSLTDSLYSILLLLSGGLNRN